MRVAQGWGHDGDGCLAAEAALAKSPVISRIWFDKPGQRLAQTNPGLRLPDPTPNLTVIGLYAATPPTELDLDTRTYGPICDTEPLPDVYCNNGSRTCPPVFGDFGFGHLNALTSVLGSNYYNTTLLTKQKGAEVWQLDEPDGDSCQRHDQGHQHHSQLHLYARGRGISSARRHAAAPSLRVDAVDPAAARAARAPRLFFV